MLFSNFVLSLPFVSREKYVEDEDEILLYRIGCFVAGR